MGTEIVICCSLLTYSIKLVGSLAGLRVRTLDPDLGESQELLVEEGRGVAGIVLADARDTRVHALRVTR